MSGPPPPPYSATWRITGKIHDVAPWTVIWHLSLPGAVTFDYASMHRLHEDLLLLSETYFNASLADAVTSSTSRFVLNGPASSVGETLYLTSAGTGDSVVSVNCAACVRQIVQAPGRGREGRFYLPSPPWSSTQYGAQLTPGAVGSLSGHLSVLFDSVNAYSSADFPSVRYAVIHRRESGAWLPAAQVEPVDTWVLNSKLSHQDRRLTNVRFP